MAWVIEFQGPSFAYMDYVYFLRQLDLARQRGESRLEVSFDRVTFFYPDGMAPFVALVNHLVGQGMSVGVGEPPLPRLVEYWASVGWLAHIQGTAAPVHKGGTYLPLTAYRTADELNTFINDALDLLAQTQAFPQGVLTAFEWSMNEIADNVLIHADSDEPGWLQMTSYPETQKVEFVVVDTGRGIRASLSESHPDLRSDEQAVATAIEKGTTRDRNVGQGNGLSGTIRIASGANGYVNIHSGRGQVRLLEQVIYRDTVAPHQGTLVTVTLPTGAEINVSEALWGHVPVPAFEPQYVTDHGVRFVVAMEASNFGNRHTGERLRNKLSNLATLHEDEPVIVDFDGIDLMSASFADEFIAKLVKQHGHVRFFGRFRFLNLSEFAATTLDQVIAQRLRE